MLIRVLLVAAGFAASVTGLALIYVPAGVLAGGAGAIALGFAWDDGKPKK